MIKLVVLLAFVAVSVWCAPSAKVASEADEAWEAPLVYTNVKIGTPAVDFKLNVDLNFENILLRGPKCTSLSCKGVQQNRTTYEPKKSSTAKDQGDPAKMRYGTPVSGEYWTDKLQVDGITDDEVGFAVLDSASQKFYNVNADGVFGLSFLGVTRGKKNLPSPVNSVLKGATKKLVNLWFKRAYNNTDRIGIVTFGKVNTDKCSDNVQYSLVSDDEDFRFKVQKIRFSKFSAHRELNAQISPDLQTIGLPSTVYKDFIRVATGNNGQDYGSCSNVKDLTLDLKIGGVYYSLQNEDFVYKMTSNSNYCKFLVHDSGAEADSDIPYALGEPFFRRFCITYDLDNKQIGFSKIK